LLHISNECRPKKPEVANAQAYFAEQTRNFEIYCESQNQIDRLIIREELVEWNKALSSAMKAAWGVDYARFQNAWYLGMYNKRNWELAEYRGVSKDKLLDHMGRTELAANLFRVTQTEERIKNHQVRGQNQLEQTHRLVGQEVRAMIIKNSGRPPESLPQEIELKDIKKELKDWYKKMLKADNSKK